MAELVLRLRDRELSRTPILHTRITLGRDVASDLVIDNVSISRTHAVLIYVDKQFRIRDSESQAGLTVNGKPTKDCVLSYGDVIGIGKFEVVLQSGAQEPPTEPKPNRPSKTADAGIETIRPARATRPDGVEPGAADAAGTEGAQPTTAGAAPTAETAPAAIAKRKPVALDLSVILKFAAIVLLLILAALGGIVWALENKWISV